MYMDQSLLGASISRSKIMGTRHRGTCVDPACLTVVDTMPETDARIVSLPIFSAGFPITIDSVGLTFPQQQIRTARALNQIGRVTYAQANCDVLGKFKPTESMVIGNPAEKM